MRTIVVSGQIRAPISAVFAAFADHEHFFALPGMTCTVDGDGLGAVRTISTNGLVFVEDITAYEASACFEYRIRTVTHEQTGWRLPLEHELGRVEFETHGDHVHLTWTTTYGFAVPVLGRIVDWFSARDTERTFGRLVERARLSLE